MRIGTIEVTRLGLGLMEADMTTIAGFFKRVLTDGEDIATVQKDVVAFRLPMQSFYHNFDHGWPPNGGK